MIHYFSCVTTHTLLCLLSSAECYVCVGVSSEGEKSAAVIEEVEEGREAEATETPVVSVARGTGGTARRSARGGTVRRRASTRTAPTPIVWDEDPPSSAGRGNTSTITIGNQLN